MADALNSILGRFGSARAAMILGVGVVAVVMMWLALSWAGKPELVPLTATSDMAAVGDITAKLDEAGITYSLVRGGSEVDVGQNDLARARVLLASAGIPARGRPGFELFDKPAWGMTDFTQRINYRRALEGELERTIRQMRGVQAAQVHLALSQENGFKAEAGPQSASVVLALGNMERPSDELVEGVSSLVASSVDGLSSDHVTVMDDNGRLLSKATEAGVDNQADKKQLGMRREMETYLEQRAEDLVAQVVGAGNVKVRVAAEMSFDKIDRTTQSINPDEQITTKEEKAQITPAPGQVAAGSTETSATYDATRTTENFTRAGGTVKRLTVAVLVNEKKVSGAVAAQVESLVRNAVGVDATRGDAISVVAIPFEVAPAASQPPADKISILTRMQPLQKPVLGLLAFLLIFALTRQAITALRPIGVSQRAMLAMPEAPAQLIAERTTEPSSRIDPAQMNAALRQPEMTARVLRTWMKEG